jgi:hypothetical protein
MVADIDGGTTGRRPGDRDAGPGEGDRPDGHDPGGHRDARPNALLRRTLYYVVYDRTSRQGPAPLVGETVGEFTVYTNTDTFHVLP